MSPNRQAIRQLSVVLTISATCSRDGAARGFVGDLLDLTGFQLCQDIDDNTFHLGKPRWKRATTKWRIW
jgi:hypothetical protein